MDDFTPLFPCDGNEPTAGATPLRSRVHGAEAAAEPFQPMPSPALPTLNCAHPANGTPELAILRNGDRITQIRIKCSCGQLLVLDCEY